MKNIYDMKIYIYIYINISDQLHKPTLSKENREALYDVSSTAVYTSGSVVSLGWRGCSTLMCKHIAVGLIYSQPLRQRDDDELCYHVI